MNVWIFYIVIIVVGVGLYVGYKYYRKRNDKRVQQQKEMVDQHKVTTTLFVIDKKKAKLSESNLPKQIIAQIPFIYKLRKVPLVTAKVGPQIITLICEDDVFKKLPTKKNVRVDLAGIFIVAINEKRK